MSRLSHEPRGRCRPRFALIVALSLLPSALAAGDSTELGFTPFPSPVSGMNIADLGVVDANGDGILDLFSTSHTFRTALLLGDGRAGFVDASDRWGLAVDPTIPGLEGSLSIPTNPNRGLHIYFEGDHLVFDSNNGDGRYRGRVGFALPVQFTVAGGASAHRFPKTVEESTARILEFAIDGVGTLRIEPWFPKHRVVVALADDTPLDQVVIGRNAVPAPAAKMTLSLVDRHGAAWADFDGDGDLDVFITAGGMVGKAPPDLRDELFRMDDGVLRNIIVDAGIVKMRARGRRVEWVDYDGDGLLDLYVGNVSSPNQLWRQKGDGHFENVAPKLGLHLRKGDLFRWIDADGDNDSDLLVAVAGAPSKLFVNTGGTFTETTLADSTLGTPKNMTVSDFDSDGDFDVFVADANTNRIFLGENGSFRVLDAVKLGFPVRSVSASWVDADNDGQMDLHVVPGNLQRQLPDGHFTSVDLDIGRQPAIAHCAWLDIDSDGDRDCICATAPAEKHRPLRLPKLGSEHWAMRNESAGNHWIAVDLIGPPRNRQAIGATLLSSVAGKQQRHMVGESDSAHWSQGHYRIYVGLGSVERPDWLDVTWPDGTHTRIDSPEADRRIEIRWRPDAS